MELATYTVAIEGIRPLMMHNSQLADPTNKYALAIKDINGTAKKNDVHYAKIMEHEWMGGLYLDDKGRPILPDHVIEGMILEAAKTQKLGKIIKAAIEVPTSPVIIHDGPKNATAADLLGNPRFRDVRGVKVKQARIMRCRPVFPRWSCVFDVKVVPSLIKDSQLSKILDIGGVQIGVGTYRPKFGRFIVTSITKK